jgi:hypothetical protein
MSGQPIVTLDVEATYERRIKRPPSRKCKNPSRIGGHGNCFGTRGCILRLEITRARGGSQKSCDRGMAVRSIERNDEVRQARTVGILRADAAPLDCRIGWRSVCSCGARASRQSSCVRTCGIHGTTFPAATVAELLAQFQVQVLGSGEGARDASRPRQRLSIGRWLGSGGDRRIFRWQVAVVAVFWATRMFGRLRPAEKTPVPFCPSPK